jgi:predicted flavoprotein YhiN
VGVTLWNASQRLASTTGNLIFTEWGLNGPAVMDISHHVSARPQAVLELSLDLLAYFREEFDHLLAQKRASSMPLRVFLFTRQVAVYQKFRCGRNPLCQVVTAPSNG